MTAIEKQTIQNKLLKLREITNLLNEFKTSSLETFVKDTTLNSAVMFNLMIGIEIVLDIGNHMLAEIFQKPAKTYRDIIIFLADSEIIPKDFAEENKSMPNFRNRLVHDYDKINLEQVYAYLQKSPDTFQVFSQYYVTFLEKMDK